MEYLHERSKGEWTPGHGPTCKFMFDNNYGGQVELMWMNCLCTNLSFIFSGSLGPC